MRELPGGGKGSREALCGAQRRRRGPRTPQRCRALRPGLGGVDPRVRSVLEPLCFALQVASVSEERDSCAVHIQELESHISELKSAAGEGLRPHYSSSLCPPLPLSALLLYSSSSLPSSSSLCPPLPLSALLFLLLLSLPSSSSLCPPLPPLPLSALLFLSLPSSSFLCPPLPLSALLSLSLPRLSPSLPCTAGSLEGRDTPVVLLVLFST